MLSVMIENSGNTAVLRCSGRIVAGEEAWTLFNSAISIENKRVVVLDLTSVTGADARGLGVLAFLKQWARLSGVKLKVIPSRPVQELLELTGLDRLFDVRAGGKMQPASECLPRVHERNTMSVGCD